MRIRTALAIIFLVLLTLVLAWAVKKDFESKNFEQLFSLGLKGSPNNYILNLNSIDLDTQTVKGILSFEGGWLIWDDKEHPIFYGKLSYVDLTYTYAILRDFVDINVGILKGKTLPASAFSKSYPAPIEFTIKALGRPEIYPFDKYFIMGAVTCPAYSVERRKKIYLNIGRNGESLSINNFVKGFFIRYPSKNELDEIRSVFAAFSGKKAPPTTDEEEKKLNNSRDRFALVMERPLYLQIMTIVLGIIVLMSALYIGFKTPLKDIPVPIIGFIIGLWGIRSILLGDLKIFPSYFDYTLLLMYLLVFAGIIFRAIKGGSKEKIKDGEKNNKCG